MQGEGGGGTQPEYWTRGVEGYFVSMKMVGFEENTQLPSSILCTREPCSQKRYMYFFNIEVHTQSIGVMLQRCYVLVRMNIYCMANHYPSEDHWYFREYLEGFSIFILYLWIAFSGDKINIF